jgi:hypothetical protein
VYACDRGATAPASTTRAHKPAGRSSAQRPTCQDGARRACRTALHCTAARLYRFLFIGSGLGGSTALLRMSYATVSVLSLYCTREEKSALSDLVKTFVSGCACPPPSPPVLTGHVSSLAPY